MLSGYDRLNLGDGFRGKGRAVFVAVLESELLCWKSHVNENTILGGWLVLISIQDSSQDFSHLLVVCSSLALCFLLWPYRETTSNGADYTSYPL